MNEKKEASEVTNPYESPAAQSGDDPAVVAVYQGKVYSTLSIAIATIFGSVLATGLLIYSNYNHFEKKSNSLIVVGLTILLTIAFMFGLLIIEFPAVLAYLGLSFVIAAISLPVIQTLLGEELEAHEESGRPFHSVFRAIFIGIGCFFAMGVMLVIAFTMFTMV